MLIKLFILNMMNIFICLLSNIIRIVYKLYSLNSVEVLIMKSLLNILLFISRVHIKYKLYDNIIFSRNMNIR